MLGVLAAENAIGALRYVLPHVPFPAPLDNFFHHHRLLALHASSGALALVAGPLQLLPPFREKHWTLHRWMGRIYCAAVLLGSLAALRLALNAQTGAIAASGFFLLALAWFSVTAIALWHILRGDSVRHRRWMIRSYFLTAAAITLRIYLPICLVLHVDYAIAYPAIAWLCWVPNALFAELWLRRTSNASGAVPQVTAVL